MKILLLAPHPFYQERGTPIAVDLLLKTLSGRGDRVDVLTYHEGDNREYQGVTIHRISPTPKIRNIRPGFSFKKLWCDWFLWKQAVSMARTGQYDVIHAIEEAGFIALRIKRKFSIPYVFDMDSSMPEQMSEKHPVLIPLLPVMKKMEKAVVSNADAIAAVCDSLVKIAEGHGGKNITLLSDISLLGVPGNAPSGEKPSLHFNGTVFMYIGNLEIYQGIDLMLESFAIARRKLSGISLVIAGGTPSDIEKYRLKAATLGIGASVEFLGPRPVSMMKHLFAACDVLVSPRIKGNNTPMKIYSYLDSGKPVLATDLPTHSQVLTQKTACLVAPNPEPFAEAMVRLAQDPTLRKHLSDKAAQLVEEKYSFKAFADKVNILYGKIEREMAAGKQ